MAAPVPPRRRSPKPKATPPPRPSDADPPAPEPVTAVEADPVPVELALPPGIDPAAMEAAWFDLATEHEAEREQQEMKARATWVEREARQRKAYELRVSARLPYRVIAEQLGISIGQAHNDVQAFSAMAVPISTKEVARRESIELYERLLREMLIGMAEAIGPAKLPFIAQILQVQGRLDKAQGIDAPVTASIGDLSTLDTVEKIDAAASELMAEMDELARQGFLRS